MKFDPIQISNERLAKLLSYYNPLTGEGSFIERFPHFLLKGQTEPIYLPLSMKELPIVKRGILNESESIIFHNARLDHDFEFWAYTNIFIKDKDTGMSIPFRLRKPQRKLLLELESMRLAGLPIRAIVTKARQWGGSTLIQFYMKWVQVRLRTNWNSAIVADVESQSLTVRAMYSSAIRTYPKHIQELNFVPFEGQTSVRYIPERGAIVSIASMQKPDKIRSQDLKMAHLTEVGLWKKTLGKEPQDVVQSLLGTIPNQPYTVFVLESTAKGVGNYFHLTWMSAVNGENAYRPIFVAWFEIETYLLYFKSDNDKLAFYHSMDEYEKYLWTLGVSLEGIHWYRYKLREFDNNTWRMQSEFPSTAEEAFQSTGQKAFAPLIIRNIQTDCTEPKFKGDVYGMADHGKEALEGIMFNHSPTGKLHIWRMPNDPPVPDSMGITNRYCVILDVGGSSQKADYTAIRVFDRFYQSDGLAPEAIATWHGKMDADLAAWKAAQIATMYHNALLIIEVNYYDSKESDEGDTYYTTLDEIGPYYDNLFSRTTPDQIKAGYPLKYGFHMNKQTKPEIINHFKKILRLGGYIEYDIRVSGEAHAFENQGFGRYGAVEGQHDDLLIVTMIGVWACYEYMTPPKLYKLSDNSKAKSKKADSMASF